MGRCISPQAGRVNIAFMETSEGPLQSSHTFLSPSYAKTFPVFGFNLKKCFKTTDTSSWIIEVSKDFFNDITHLFKFGNIEEKEVPYSMLKICYLTETVKWISNTVQFHCCLFLLHPLKSLLKPPLNMQGNHNIFNPLFLLLNAPKFNSSSVDKYSKTKYVIKQHSWHCE